MAIQGPEFAMADFLQSFADVVRPSRARPLVVHDEDLELVPASQVHNPTELRIAGLLPTATFELFRQVIPAGESSDMQRHYHETVHFVVSGDGHSEIEVGEGEAEVVTWSTGSFVYTPPWAWHRHFNASVDEPVQFLTIESSRLLNLFGLVRRQSAGLVDLAEARRQHPGPAPTEETP